MEEKNFIISFVFKKVKIVLYIFFVLMLTVFIFLRYTGIISPLIWSWKHPEVTLVEDGTTPGYYQNNDQLWVNVNFDENHSNINSAKIWIDGYESKSQKLEEGSNTYIFKNLNMEGKEQKDFDVMYEIDWSLWGHEEGTLTTATMIQTADISIDSVERTETTMNITTTREGDFYNIGDIFPNIAPQYSDLSTSGIYYINKNSVPYKMIENSNNKLLLIEKANDFINDNDRKNNYENYNIILNLLDEFIVYNYEIQDGTTTNGITEIHTSNVNQSQVVPLEPYSSYQMVGLGIAKDPLADEGEDQWFLTFSKPFQANIYGIPQITSMTGTTNAEGDLTIQTYVDETNYDNTAKTYMHYTIYTSDVNGTKGEYVDDVFVPKSDTNFDYRYTFENIMYDEKFQEIIEQQNPDNLYVYFESEMWYGSNITPVYDPANPTTGGNYTLFKHSNVSSGLSSIAKTNYVPITMYTGFSFSTYFVSQSSTGTKYPAAVEVSTLSIWNGNTPDTNVDVYWRINNSLDQLYAEDAYDELSQSKSYYVWNTFPTPWFNIGDMFTITLMITTPEYDWYGTPTGQTITTEQEVSYRVDYV